jgi:acyl carrier protein
MRTDIETGVREIIGRVSRVDVSSLGRDDDLVEQLGVDSLEGLQILAGVEKRFDVRLPDEELITMRTIGRIEAAVARLRTSNFELRT